MTKDNEYELALKTVKQSKMTWLYIRTRTANTIRCDNLVRLKDETRPEVYLRTICIKRMKFYFHAVSLKVGLFFN